MAHTCPNCQQACYCSGDWDDAFVNSDTWAWVNCRHECEEEPDDEYFEEDFINDNDQNS